MPHIVFADRAFNISAEHAESAKAKLIDAYRTKSCSAIEVTDEDGDTSWLLWTPGAPIVINDWDVPIFG